MKLRDILNSDNKKMAKSVTIEYRTYYDDQDLLAGYAEYSKGHLKPLDGDSYSLDDDFYKWEFGSVDVPNDSLTVWYESNFIRG